MTIKAPTSEQKESMDFLFRTRSQHKDNFMAWLEDCHKAAVDKILLSDKDNVERSVGELSALNDIITILARI